MLDELRKEEQLLRIQMWILAEAKRDTDRAVKYVEVVADRAQRIQNRIDKLKATLVLCQ